MRVAFYFKPENTYPERIYVLYGDWVSRNKRAMGISKSLPFFKRSATPKEAATLAEATRMRYWQYEDLQTLLNDEARFMSPSSLAEFTQALHNELAASRSQSLAAQLPSLDIPVGRGYTRKQETPSKAIRPILRAYGQCRIVFRLSAKKMRERAEKRAMSASPKNIDRQLPFSHRGAKAGKQLGLGLLAAHSS